MRSVPFYRHSLTSKDADAMSEVLRGIFLTTGPRTRQFEEELARYLGASFATGIMSCTSALHLTLLARGIGPGDEVITTPMTFIATANAVLHTGAKPVLVDVEPTTGNIDVAQVEQAITERTKAIIPVHLYGTMVDMRRLHEIAQRFGLYVIEDAAHALEAVRDGVRPGQLGDAACFSFYATKNLTSGEGGAIVTNDGELHERLSWLRMHGMSKSAADRYTARYQHWDMVGLGYKANMNDLQAALLLSQMPRLEQQLERREIVGQRYEAAFRETESVGFPTIPPGAKSARHLFTIWVPPERRDDILARLQERQIGVAVNYRAIHLLTYYRERFGFREGDFPNAEAIGNSTISLPMYPGLEDEDVDAVIEAVRSVCEGVTGMTLKAEGKVGSDHRVQSVSPL